VAVTIKCLKVSNRQMTQAVFTQLPKLSELITDDYELAGNVWGWVNYCPKGEDAEMRQFVVEVDGKLYRAASHAHSVSLHKPQTHDNYTVGAFLAFWDRIAAVGFAMLAESIKAKEDRNPCGKNGLNLGAFPPLSSVSVIQTWREDNRGNTRAAVGIWVEPDTALRTVFEHKYAYVLGSQGEFGRGAVPVAWHEGTAGFVASMARVTVAESREMAQTVIDGIVAHIEKLNQVRSLLRAADQLFIAV
jgi:hypothetical protein